MYKNQHSFQRLKEYQKSSKHIFMPKKKIATSPIIHTRLEVQPTWATFPATNFRIEINGLHSERKGFHFHNRAQPPRSDDVLKPSLSIPCHTLNHEGNSNKRQITNTKVIFDFITYVIATLY